MICVQLAFRCGLGFIKRWSLYSHPLWTVDQSRRRWWLNPSRWPRNHPTGKSSEPNLHDFGVQNIIFPGCNSKCPRWSMNHTMQFCYLWSWHVTWSQARESFASFSQQLLLDIHVTLEFSEVWYLIPISYMDAMGFDPPNKILIKHRRKVFPI